MLVLSRKVKQAIQIADDIEIKILGIEGDQVKIGIDAPKHIEIHRKEVFLAIQEENSAAAKMISVDALRGFLQNSDQKSK